MDDDVYRNAAYARAFAAVPKRLTKWLEIGCGAAATLTKLALHNGPAGVQITAFEANAQSAASAKEQLRTALSCAPKDKRKLSRVNVVAGKSTQPELLGAADRTFDLLYHELFGVFASSEGCALMPTHARQTYAALLPNHTPITTPGPRPWAAAICR